jgi:hypothetical protein
MPPTRHVRAVFDRVEPVFEEGQMGVEIGFRPSSSRFGAERIDDFADLGPELSVPAVAGIGKVVRILRAARIAAPRDPMSLAGRMDLAVSLLEKARGREMRLEVRSRSRIRFAAWTESGVETLENVSEVIERDRELLVMRHGGRFPVRFDLDQVVRRVTETQRWFEVLGVERA